MSTNRDKYYAQYPVNHPAYKVIRLAGEKIEQAAEKYFSGRMLEIGCGTKAKGLLVGKYVDQHIGLDHEETIHDKSNIDIFGTAYDIPEPDKSYDCVLSTSVLEHLEEPELALHEAYRVLKPGGYALYTMPLFWHLHEEPRDFFRYTPYGLQHLFSKANFEVVELQALSGFITTYATASSYYFRRFRRGIFRPLVDAVIIFNNLLLTKFDRGRLRDERFSWQFLIVARRPIPQISSA